MKCVKRVRAKGAGPMCVCIDSGHRSGCSSVWFGLVWFGFGDVRCGIRCGVMWCGVAWCGEAWCGAARVWCGAARRDVA